MSTSKTYQQSLADAGSENRPPMLERGSYIPWARRFKRFLNRKRENRKWLLKALEDGPYLFRNITPTGSIIPRLQDVEDLQGDDLVYYDAEMELMNMILLSIPNEIYNSVDSCKTTKEMWACVERLKRGTIQNQVDRETRFTNEFDQFIAEPGESLVSVYNHFAQLMNDLERNNMKFPTISVNTKFLNSLQPEWLKYKLVNASRAKKLEKSHDPLALVAHTLLAKAITQNFSNPTNNRLCASSYTKNQAVVQGDRVNIQSKNSGNVGRNNRRAYVQEEVVEGMNATNETANVQRIVRTPTPGNTSTGQCYNYGGKGHYARNYPKPRVRDSKYFMEQMLLAKQDEAGVILTDEQNDFLFADASRMEEIEELSANICLMARIQPADQNSDDEPSYDTIDDDQINSNIQFDSVKGNVNSGSVEKDTHVYDLCALETLARNAYDEAAKQQRFAQKVQQQNMTLTSQIEMYKERNRCLVEFGLVVGWGDFWVMLCGDLALGVRVWGCVLVGWVVLWGVVVVVDGVVDCHGGVKPLLNELLDYFDGFQYLFQRDIKEMKDAFEQNDLLKDQLMEASLKHDIELCVLINHERVDKSLHDELEQVKKKSLEIQEGLKARIKILEKDKLEDENVSLDFKVQSLIKERDNAKMEYKKLFDSIKKTRSQTQKEMDELIAHVSEKTYAYGAIRAENQNLLVTISELKARMKNGENGKSVNTKFDKTHGSQSFLCVTPLNKNASQKQTVVLKTKENHVESKPVTLQTSHNKQTGTHQNTNVISPGMYRVVTQQESQTNKTKNVLSSTGMNATSSVKRPKSRDSHVKTSVLDVSKNEAKKEAVYVRKNKQTDNTFAKVVSNKENVIDVAVANASKAKTLLCVSCMQNVLIPCHDKCVAKHKLNVRSNARRTFSVNSRIPKSSETTFVAPKTRFSEKATQSKTLDTTSVASKSKIDEASASKARDKVSSAFKKKKRNMRDKPLSPFMLNKIRTSRLWQKWFESQPNVMWTPVNTKPHAHTNPSNTKPLVVQIVLWVVDSGCSKHMTGDHSLLRNFIEKFMGTVRFGNDNFAAITGYGGRDSNLYTISISDMAASSPICLMSKATLTKSWLWHR
ncbi:hypothetical protein Tco_1568325 [Tanacetum coccineum]